MTKFLRLPRLAFTIAVVGTAVALFATSAAFGAGTSSTPAGGSIHVFATSPGTGTGGKVLITGAIGDHGKTLNINKAGKPDANGTFVKLTLTKGTFQINATKLDAEANHAFSSAKFNRVTCTMAAVFSGPVTLLNGTGLYTGISGTAHITVSLGFILPRVASGTHKGQCNLSNNAQPTASVQLVEGTGTVNFA